MASSYGYEKNEDSWAQCPICSEIYQEPKILICGHTLCYPCVTKIHNGSKVECPICSKVTELPITALTPNYIAKDMADAVRRCKLKQNAINSIEQFHEMVATVCEKLNEKLQNWQIICDLLNGICARSLEMKEKSKSMDIQYCHQSLKDMEKMTQIVTDIESNFGHLQEAPLLVSLEQNRHSILVDENIKLPDLESMTLEEQTGTSTDEPMIAKKETAATHVLVIGGYFGGVRSNPLVSLEVYDPYNEANNQILQCNLHETRYRHVAVVLWNTLYVAGGKNAGKIMKLVELFDPINHQWLRYGPEMKEERQCFAAVAVQNQLMVFGGWMEGGANDDLSSCESFDPITDTWSSLPSMENARGAHCAVEFDGKIYVTGGYVNKKISSSLSIFNPNAMSWISGPSMKQDLDSAAAAKLHSGIVVCGGNDGTRRLKSCAMLDPREKKWMDIAPMQQERKGHALVDFNDKLLAMGGCDANRKELSAVEEYDPRANQWRSVQSLINEQAFFAAVAVPS